MIQPALRFPFVILLFAICSITGAFASFSAESSQTDKFNAAKRLKTVLGSGADVAPYKGKPAYNVLEMDYNLPLETRKAINTKWLDDAIDRGDELILKTDPIKWDRFMREIGKESFYNELELPQLLRRGVIDGSPLF